MAGFKENSYIFNLLCFTTITSTYGLNSELFKNDLKRLATPMVFNRITKHAPVVINMKSDLPKPIRTSHIQTLSSLNNKMKFTEINTLVAKSPTKKFPRSLDFPMLPLVPFFVSVMPNLNSILPIFPPALRKRPALNHHELQIKRLVNVKS